MNTMENAKHQKQKYNKTSIIKIKKNIINTRTTKQEKKIYYDL